MFFLGFSSGLPFLLVGVTVSAWLHLAGVSLELISLISGATFAYNFKFLWAPLVDHWRIPVFCRLGQRRGWIFAAQILLAMALLGMAWLTPALSLGVFVVTIAVAAFAGATQDIAIDAYRVEIAPLEEQGALASTYTLGYRLALIASGVGALYIAQYGSWSWAYVAMAALLLIPAVAVLMAREPQQSRPRAKSVAEALRSGVIGPFREFFARGGVMLGLALLAFVGLFKLPDQMVGVVAYPFYLDTGFSLAQIAEVSKLYGVAVSLIGAFLGGFVVARWGIKRPLIVAAVAIGFSNLLFLSMAHHPGATLWFVLALSGDNLAQGFGGTVLVAFLSGLTNRQYTATQYALLSSLANLPGKVIALFSGLLVESFGYQGFFVLSSISIVPTLGLLWWLYARLEKVLPIESEVG